MQNSSQNFLKIFSFCSFVYLTERWYNTHVMDAVIILNKPKEMTSFSAVRQCRNLFSEKKAGHTGTLDPNATGVMIVLLGKYTKLVPYCIKDHKHYQAEFVMGKCTDTGDIWGTILDEKAPVLHSEEELQRTAHAFLGDIRQVPPMYSAIKINGQKLVDLARKGIEVERKQREVHISSLSVRHMHDDVYAMDAVVSSGTYIRTLIEDFAAELGELATMTSLVRTGIEDVSLSDAQTFEQLQENPVLIEPKRIIDPEWKFVEAGIYERYVLSGRHVTLHSNAPKVIFTKGDTMLAAYTKGEDGLYHCQRGLL